MVCWLENDVQSMAAHSSGRLRRDTRREKSTPRKKLTSEVTEADEIASSNNT